MARSTIPAPTDAEIDATLRRFFEEDVPIAEAEQVIARLKPVSGRVVARVLHRVVDPDPHVRAVASGLLRELADRSAIRPLRNLLRDPALDDEVKLEIFGVLSDLGAQVDEAAFFESLQDPDAAMRRMLERTVASWENPEELSNWVAMAQDQLSPEVQAAYIDDVAALKDPQALTFFLCMAQSEHEEVALTALDALDRLGDPVALPDLQDLAAYHVSVQVREEARQVADRLARRPARPGPALALPPLDQCLLTTIDGDGGQIAFVTRRHPDGRLAMLDVMFNDHEGIKEALGQGDFDFEQFSEILDDLEDEGIVPVEVGFSRVRNAVEAARQLTLKVGRRLPADFVIWRFLLAGDDPGPRPEPALPEVDLVAQPELLDGVYELMDLEEFDAWFFNSDELRGFDQRVRRLKRDAHFAGRLGQLIREAIPALVPPTRRRMIRDRLRRQAVLLAEIYPDRPELARWAVAAVAGLADDSPVTPDDHPLLQEMVLRSLENALGQPLREEV
jgi:hypothetical protein